jgi:hypothetical protein
MVGYTRQRVSQIANGEDADANDVAAELNQVQAAFNSSTGHSHDGTSAEGAPITKTGPNQEYVSTDTTLGPKTTATYDLGTTSIRWKDGFFSGAITAANFTGLASSATALATPRTLTIGSTGKAFDGSANVSWSLSEIGVNNATLTLATSGIATGSQTFTANQGSNATFTVDVPATNLGYTAASGNGVVTSSTGTDATLPAATESNAGLLTAADKTKLDGIATGAQVNVATNLGATAGTTAGPTITSSTGSGVVIPSASDSASGVVTTAAQTFAGAKTFSTPLGIESGGTGEGSAEAALVALGAATAAQGALADTAVQPADLADIATSGEYADLANNPWVTPLAVAAPDRDFDTVLAGGVYAVTDDWENGPDGAGSLPYEGTLIVVPSGETTGASYEQTLNLAGAKWTRTGTGATPIWGDWQDLRTGGGASDWTELAPVATTSGTGFDLTSIPAGTNEIEVYCVGVSLNTTGGVKIQIGSDGTPVTTGYTYRLVIIGSVVSPTDGFTTGNAGAASALQAVFRLYKVDGDQWFCDLQSEVGNGMGFGIGSVSLSGALDILRVLPITSGHNFDAGKVIVRYR